ncbi:MULTISPECIES: flagellar hook-associated protein 3 [unclassified Pseudomonas]|uniref:flagellar hook-associated protein 3 n=1 Tax=unclassified Pseudomonas TaxID=196821 RepID=UPI002AC90BF4|nr:MULTISPECIES: flagellar hook-associated protein 3 [unclassified Pseudomonas]MEB0045467.1 flagellar hook-associated protein 3 [Pseudomonas sp. Dout3]MEB0097085.1 flagellar hook-associated protein 3 [Pseudomonas sp. DC1.2]WPX60482.1 flagellar hook-associated protein 3 [Pseudomonas sp. DC1.2]
MRISTAQYYETTAANYQRNFNKAVATSAEASSLTRINTASDDPIGAGRLLQLGQQSALLDQYNGNISSIKSGLSLQETTLTSIGTALQRAKEVALSASSGNATDADRKAYASELGQIQQQVLGLMNSKDSAGSYLFSGSKTDTPPYSQNSDGTYTYSGDQTSINLGIGDGLSVATNTTGWDAFQQSINTSRTQVSMTAPATDDGRVTLSNGEVNSSTTFNAKFASGQPYTVSFVSSTQLKITDGLGNDVTAEASQGGVVSNANGSNQAVSFRGINMNLNINLGASDTNPDAVIAGHSFQLSAKPDSFNTSRSPGNGSTAVVTATSVTNSTAYNNAFPAGGAILKFTSATNYDLYAAPVTTDSKPVSSGTMVGSNATAAGVTFTLGGAPAAGDQFTVQSNNHQTQNVLDTLGQMVNAMNVPIDNNAVAKQKFQAAIDSGINNLGSATDQLGTAITSIGARGNSLDDQSATNQSLTLANTTTQSSIRDSDPAEVMTRLTLQQTMLQAAQLAFSKITSLGLFNKI